MRRLNRLRNAFIALTTGLGLAPLTATAEDVVIDIVGGVEGGIPIAVVPFQVREGTPSENDIASIISSNLARSGRFEVTPEQDLVATPGRMEEVQFSSWRALGADYLTVGEITPTDDERYTVRYELLDVFQGERTDGRSYRAAERHLRTLAHTLSDRIYEAITDRPGAYTQSIAYVAVEQGESDDGESRQYRLVIADSDGHRPQTILTSDDPLLSPAWSPDREHLAYVSFEGKRSEVFIQSVRTGERERVASFRGINSAPAWSPDGEQLAVTLSRDGAANIHLIEIESGEVRPLTEHWAIDTEAAWGPEGEWLYFTSDRGGRPQIYRTTPDGSETERITYDGDYNAAPDIAPDGEHMAMVHRRDGKYYIAVQDLKNEAVQIISEGPADESPSFAPNSDLVIYATGGEAGERLATASVLGNAVAPLTATKGDKTRVREPAW